MKERSTVHGDTSGIVDKAVADIMEVVHARPTLYFLATLPLHELWVREHLIIHSLPTSYIGESEKGRLHDAHEALHDRWFWEICDDKRNCAFLKDEPDCSPSEHYGQPCAPAILNGKIICAIGKKR